MKITFLRKQQFEPLRPYLIVDDGDIGSRGQWYCSDATDVLSKLSSHLQPSITREGPQHSVDQIFLGIEIYTSLGSKWTKYKGKHIFH